MRGVSRRLIRVHVLLRAEQLELLRRRARAEGGSVSHAVREILDRHAGTVAVPTRAQHVRSAASRFLSETSRS